MIVFDTSVAVKWTVKEQDHPEAIAVLEVDEERIAPDLLLPELAYVLRKKAIRGEIPPEHCGFAIGAVREAIGQFIPSIDLVDDAIALSIELNHSAYDCFFLACALGRGVLISADEVFVRKCETTGYGEFVILLREADNARLSASAAFRSLDAQTISTIERLAPKIEATFTALYEAAKASVPGRIKFINSQELLPGFKSPASLSLVKHLEKLPPSELRILLALGWLGREYHGSADWPQLLADADHTAREGFDRHKGYILAQMANVPRGIVKLRDAADGRKS